MMKLNKTIICILFSGLLSACGGGQFEPDYGQGSPTDTRRINGELAFTSPSLMKMAESFRIAGDYTNAIRIYQRAANENAKHVPSRLALGQIYQRLGATDGAAVFYKQVLDLDPENTDAQLGLGQMMVRANKPQEAVKYLEEVAKKNPDNFRIYNSIGLAYDLEGLHEKAQFAYGEGLNKSPNHISLLNNLALSFAISGEYAPAIQLLSKAINLDYSQTTAQQNLVMVYALSGEEDAARNMAASFNTPDEINANLAHYNWLKSLSSKRRAQAIFLDIKSFPTEEEVTVPENVVQVRTDDVTAPDEEMDPKKRMLQDILNAEEGITETPEPIEQPTVIQPANQVEARIEPEEKAPDMYDVEEKEYYRVQLGSYLNEESAISDWNRLQNKAPEILSSVMMETKKVTVANNQERYRLYSGHFDNYSAAKETCLALEAKELSCLVTKE